MSVLIKKNTLFYCQKYLMLMMRCGQLFRFHMLTYSAVVCSRFFVFKELSKISWKGLVHVQVCVIKWLHREQSMNAAPAKADHFPWAFCSCHNTHCSNCCIQLEKLLSQNLIDSCCNALAVLELAWPIIVFLVMSFLKFYTQKFLKI